LNNQDEHGLRDVQAQPLKILIVRVAQYATESQLPWIPNDPFGPYVATPVKYRQVAFIFWTNRNHFQVIAKTGQFGQLQYSGMANGGHLFRPED